MSSGGSARSSSVASPEHLESLLPCVVEHDDEGVPELLLESSDSLAPSRASSRLELREEPSSVKVVVAPLLVSTPIATTLLDLDDNEPSVGSMPDDRLAAQDMSDDKELASSKGVDSPPSQVRLPLLPTCSSRIPSPALVTDERRYRPTVHLFGRPGRSRRLYVRPRCGRAELESPAPRQSLCALLPCAQRALTSFLLTRAAPPVAGRHLVSLSSCGHPNPPPRRSDRGASCSRHRAHGGLARA